MKTIKSLLIVLVVLTVCRCDAQTNTLLKLGKDVVSFFKDTTNFWGQQTAIVGVSGLYSFGREKDSTAPKKNTFGAALDIRFPLDDKGQVSVGFFAAYFNKHVYDGSLSTTLGTTWTIPLINQPVYTFVEGGPTLNFSHPDTIGAQTFTGAVWKHDFVKATSTKAPWTLFLNGAGGKLTDFEGWVGLFGAEVGHKF